MIDPLLLKTFITIVDEGSFSAAAVRLHLTQSTISGHIRRLESYIGQPLLNRTTRSVALTANGQQLLTYARAIITLNNEAIAHFSPSALHGKIRIGIAEDFAHPMLLRLFQQVMNTYPGVTIEVEVTIPGLMLAAMAQGAIDIVIGAQCCPSASGRLLWREPLVWASAEQTRLPLPSPLPLALFPEPCPYREAALASLAQWGIQRRIAMLCHSGPSLRAAALSGFAIVPMATSQLGPGILTLDSTYGLPELAAIEFRLFSHQQEDEQSLVSILCNKIIYCCYQMRAGWRGTQVL